MALALADATGGGLISLDARTQRILVCLEGTPDRPLDDLRVLIVGDLLRRLVEDFNGGQAIVAVASPQPERLGTALHRYSVRYPMVAVETVAEAAEWLVDIPHVLVTGTAPLRWEAALPARCHVRVGAVPSRAEFADVDPLTVRLALVAHHYGAPAALDETALRQAAIMLDRWRRKIAGWAMSPSEPVAAASDALLRTALNNDLDVPAALLHLRRLEDDPDVPAGAKFETFALADRLLGLDLERSVGYGGRP